MDKETFLTIYNKDYVEKHVTRKKYKGSQEFKDPMGESFRQYLKLDPKDLHEGEEHYEEYLKTVKINYPSLYKKYFSTPVDEKLVVDNFNLLKETVYQSDYCDMDKQMALARAAQALTDKIHLPDDLFIPLTTTAFTFRNPTDMQKDALKPRERHGKPGSNIGMSRKIQDILHITTGVSEYGGVISDLGNIIIEDHMHGKIIHPPCGCAQHPIVPEEDKK